MTCNLEARKGTSFSRQYRDLPARSSQTQLSPFAPRIAMVLRSPVKTLVAIEAFICFAPLAFLLFLGVVMAPFQVYVAFTKPLDWEAAVTFVGQVVCGLAGFLTLVYVLASLFNERDSASATAVSRESRRMFSFPVFLAQLASKNIWKL